MADTIGAIIPLGKGFECAGIFNDVGKLFNFALLPSICDAGLITATTQNRCSGKTEVENLFGEISNRVLKLK